jgi:hypothetical protein
MRVLHYTSPLHAQTSRKCGAPATGSAWGATAELGAQVPGGRQERESPMSAACPPLSAASVHPCLPQNYPMSMYTNVVNSLHLHPCPCSVESRILPMPNREGKLSTKVDLVEGAGPDQQC